VSVRRRRLLVGSEMGGRLSKAVVACRFWSTRSTRGVPCARRAASHAPGARLGAAAESEEPREERRFVNQQLPTRGIEDGVGQSVHRAAPERPGDTIGAEQMRVFGNELGFCDELRHRGNGGRSSGHW